MVAKKRNVVSFGLTIWRLQPLECPMKTMGKTHLTALLLAIAGPEFMKIW